MKIPSWLLLALLFFTIGILYQLFIQSRKTAGPTPDPAPLPEPLEWPVSDEITSYRRIPLLTAYEQQNYMKLRQYAAEHDLLICPKIRLADLIEPKPNPTRAVWQKHFNMICSKHVDVTLCDRDMNVRVIIELDDRSHQRQDRQTRDRFVDVVLRNSGYRIIHIPEFNDQTVTELNLILGIPIVKPETELKPAVRTEPTYEEWKAQRLAQIDQ